MDDNNENNNDWTVKLADHTTHDTITLHDVSSLAELEESDSLGFQRIAQSFRSFVIFLASKELEDKYRRKEIDKFLFKVAKDDYYLEDPETKLEEDIYELLTDDEFYKRNQNLIDFHTDEVFRLFSGGAISIANQEISLQINLKPRHLA